MKIKHLIITAALFLASTVGIMAQGMQMPPIPVKSEGQAGLREDNNV